MAGKPTSETEVILDADGQAVFAVMKAVEKQLGTINTQVATIGKTAGMSADKFKQSLEVTVKQLRDAMTQMNTLAKAQNTPGMQIQLLNAQEGLGKATRRATEYAQSINTARNSVEALRGKINDLNREVAAEGQAGRGATISQRDRLAVYEKQLAALKALGAQQEQNDRRISRTKGGGDLSAELAAYEKAQARLSSAALNPRRTDLTKEIKSAQFAQDELTSAVNRTRTAQASLAREQRSQMLALAGRDVRGMTATLPSKTVQSGLGFERQLAENRLAGATGADLGPAREALRLAEARVRAIDAIVRSEQLEITQLQARNRLEAEAAARLGGKTNKEYMVGEAAKIREITQLEQSRAANAARIAQLRQEANTAVGQEASKLLEQLAVEKAIGAQLKLNLSELNAETRAREKNEALAAKEARASAGPAPAGPKSVLPAGGFPTVFARTAAYAVAGGAFFALISSLKQAGDYVTELDDKLKTLQAVANATDEEMVGLTGSIFTVGENSRYSLVDLTEMATKLAQAGVSAGTMGQALSSVATLATASGSTTSEAVDLITAALGAFQLQANETPRVADLMTSALNRTRLTVNQAALAIQYVGATANEQNISLEQLLATAATLSQAGIRSGSTIGTGMRQFLVDLQSPSDKLTEQLGRLGIKASEVDVATRGLPAVLQTLHDKGFGAASAYGGLETRAAAFYLVARNNIPLMQELQIQMAEGGAAAQANERAMNSLAAQWQRFQNIVGEGFADSATGIMATFKNLLKQISDNIVKARELAKGQSDRMAGGYNAYSKQAGGNQVEAFINYQNENLIPNAIAGISKLQEFNLNLLDGNYWRGGAGWGTRWKEYTAGLAEAGVASEQLTTTMHQQGEVVQEHQTKVAALEQEMSRLVLQQDSITPGSKQLSIETINLTSRFEGLATQLDGTTGGVQGLINAMQRLKNQESGLLVESLQGQVATASLGIASAARERESALGRLRGSQFYNQLNPQQKLAAKNLSSSNAEVRQGASGVLSDRMNSERAKKNFDAVTLLADAINANGNIATNEGVIRLGNSQIRGAKQDATPIGQAMQATSRSVEALVTQMRSADPADRKAIASKIENFLKPLETQMRQNIKTTGAAKNPFQVGALGQLETYRTQYKGIMMPSKSETAAAKRADREADRNAQRPVVTRQDILSTVRDTLGGSVRYDGSGYRSQAQQDAIKSKTKARVSEHTTGIAQDFPTGDVSDAQGERMARRVEATLKARGISAKVQFENARDGNGTGKHIHVGVARGTRLGAGADLDGSQSLGKNNEDLAKLDTATADRGLKSTIKDLRYATSQAVFDDGERAARAAFEKWKDALTKQTEEEIANSTMGDTQEKLRKQELAQQIAQRLEEVNTAIFDGIMKNFDAQIAAVNKALEDKTAKSQEAVNLAQAQITGFGLASNNNHIPDYVQQLAQGRLGRAQEQASRDRLANLPETIASSQGILANMKIKYGTETNKGEAETLKKQIDDLTASIAALKDEKLGLEQAFSSGSLVPQTVQDGLDQAIAAFRETHNVTNSFSQDLVENMGGALTTVHEGLTTMFTDIMTGSTSVLGAFANFVQGMIKYMIQLAARAVALKVFNLILNAVGSAAGSKLAPASVSVANSGAMVGGGGAPLSYTAPSFGMTGGGNLHGDGLMHLYGGGGRVTNGSRTRDSVNAKIAKDEWVVNSKAVDSVGHDFMARLNSQGAAALDGLRGSPIIVPQGSQETNVYIVKPDTKPQLGKNDILLTVQEDILSGGETKKLIHHVSQGG